MPVDEATPGQDPEPLDDSHAESPEDDAVQTPPIEPSDAGDAGDAGDVSPQHRAGAVTSWLRDAFARLPSVSRPLATPDPLQALVSQAAAVPRDPMSRAARAGEVIAALAPGAPGGVMAPEGAPRVAHVIGRDAELERALAALAADDALCIHSDGIPGVGKTIFAVEVASRAAERSLFPGGAVWISCETLSGDDGLAEVITRVARGLREERALAALDPETRQAELVAGLRRTHRAPTLLALDHIEPTLDAAALLDTLTGGYVITLLTTQRAIDDARLTAFALAPLASPFAEQLFTERLRLRDPQRPHADEASLASQVTRALGGLPLLIDLAAAMAGIYGATLDTALAEAQADGVAGVPSGLRARIDRLWSALSLEQRRTLAGLALIDGATFPRATALAIARVAVQETAQAAADDAGSAAAPFDSAESWRARAAQALDALIGLGIVEAMAAGRLRLHGQTRQRLAPRLAELGAATQDALGTAMADWWLTYARDHSGYEGGAGLEAEAAGLMGALTWAHAHGHARVVLDLAESLGQAWRGHGRRDDLLHIAAWAAEAADAEGQLRERLWARYQLALAQTEAGRLAQARAGFAEALRLARELGDRLAIRDGAHALAALAARAGDSEQARAGFAEALALAREMDDPVATRDELHGLAILDAQAGQLDVAHAEYAEALALARELADSAAVSLELHGLALVQMREGELEAAQTALTEALALARELDDRGAQIDVLLDLGALDAQRGETDFARDELEHALALAEQTRDARRAARALVWLAEVEAATGFPSAATERFEQARALYERLGDGEAVRVTERMRALSDAS